MIVAGVGFRRGTSADEIERVVRLALGLFELPAELIDFGREREVRGCGHRVRSYQPLNS